MINNSINNDNNGIIIDTIKQTLSVTKYHQHKRFTHNDVSD